MGQTITSVTDMVSYAGDLRRAAKQVPDPGVSAKIQQSAAQLEQQALNQVVGQAGPGIGQLLDTFA
jgi:hypothetical protein